MVYWMSNNLLDWSCRQMIDWLCHGMRIGDCDWLMYLVCLCKMSWCHWSMMNCLGYCMMNWLDFCMRNLLGWDDKICWVSLDMINGLSLYNLRMTYAWVNWFWRGMVLLRGRWMAGWSSCHFLWSGVVDLNILILMHNGSFFMFLRVFGWSLHMCFKWDMLNWCNDDMTWDSGMNSSILVHLRCWMGWSIDMLWCWMLSLFSFINHIMDTFCNFIISLNKHLFLFWMKWFVGKNLMI